ncbi:hypothetical protein VNO77_19584 [Canavalia gladiata]|uniref:Uncharacterized protein n=1 Tax=Canavalia gladiata TaxID=3824 RepID=A0AAN9LMS9_CANGL
MQDVLRAQQMFDGFKGQDNDNDSATSSSKICATGFSLACHVDELMFEEISETSYAKTPKMVVVKKEKL